MLGKHKLRDRLTSTELKDKSRILEKLEIIDNNNKKEVNRLRKDEHFRIILLDWICERKYYSSCCHKPC